MTTILADARLGLMVSDSNLVAGDRKWSGPKVIRIRGDLVGYAGASQTYMKAIACLRRREELTADIWGADEDTDLLVLTPRGLFHYAGGPTAERVTSGRESIGTGGPAAMAAYEALGWQDPRRAVGLACKYDANSARPVRVYRLRSP